MHNLASWNGVRHEVALGAISSNQISKPQLCVPPKKHRHASHVNVLLSYGVYWPVSVFAINFLDAMERTPLMLFLPKPASAGGYEFSASLS